MNQRLYWADTLERVARPVLEALSRGELRAVMPVEQKPGRPRTNVTYLEALGRTLLGLAPWLELGSSGETEQARVSGLRALALKAIDSATDPASPDYMNFGFEHGAQPIVDAAFLAHALARAPRALLGAMEPRVKRNLAAGFKSLRVGGKPGYNNWLLFSAMIETALCLMGEDWDQMRVDYAIRQTEQWYVGDGVYSDGPQYHWDYYNSFVIQPMYIDILATVRRYYPEWERLYPLAVERGARYAVLLERMVAPDGSFPVTGRSLCYRCGAFQSLAQAALEHSLPASLPPAQARCALDAVIRRTMEASGTFDANGWLRIGVCGAQPSLGEDYISTGSLYLCTAGFLPLGLPADDPFWSGADEPWTARRVFERHEDLPADHALSQS